MIDKALIIKIIKKLEGEEGIKTIGRKSRHCIVETKMLMKTVDNNSILDKNWL